MNLIYDWWPVWLTVIGVGFAVPEAAAIVNKTEGDTLSERTRAWFHTKTKTGRTAFVIFWAALLGVWIWFSGHILNIWS